MIWGAAGSRHGSARGSRRWPPRRYLREGLRDAGETLSPGHHVPSQQGPAGGHRRARTRGLTRKSSDQTARTGATSDALEGQGAGARMDLIPSSLGFKCIEIGDYQEHPKWAQSEAFWHFPHHPPGPDLNIPTHPPWDSWEQLVPLGWGAAGRDQWRRPAGGVGAGTGRWGGGLRGDQAEGPHGTQSLCPTADSARGAAMRRRRSAGRSGGASTGIGFGCEDTAGC